MNRPTICFDKDCEIIITDFTEASFDQGFSFVCYGKMKKKHLFIERETKHENDISRCVYTPLKGMIRFFECFEDLCSDIALQIIVMDKLQPLICDVCKQTVKRSLEGLMTKQDNNIKKCLKCRED